MYNYQSATSPHETRKLAKIVSGVETLSPQHANTLIANLSKSNNSSLQE